MRLEIKLQLGKSGPGSVDREFKCEIGGYSSWHTKPWRWSNESKTQQGEDTPLYTNISWLCFSLRTHDWRDWAWDSAKETHVRISTAPSLENA